MVEEEKNRWVEEITYAAANWEENKQSADNVQKNCFICRIPAHMTTSETRNKYKPQLVSLGPYHHGLEHLKPMEEVKERALVQLLYESRKDIQLLIDCLRPRKKALMDAYESLNEEWQQQDGKFLKMLILDGCFIIYILNKDFGKYSKYDPIFSENLQTTDIQLIKRDMLLLENQVPFILLEKLMQVFEINSREAILQKFFFSGTCLKVKLGDTTNHLLDIIRLTMVQELPKAQAEDTHYSEGQDPSGGSPFGGDSSGHESPDGGGGGGGDPSSDGGRSTPIRKNNYSATMLYHSYIKFIRSSSDSFMGVTLVKYTVHLPSIVIDEYSEAFYSNLIAFEQLCFPVHRIISSFFLLMGGLLVTPEDARLFRDSEIIQRHAMSDVAVIEIIQNIIKGLSFSENDEFFLLQQQLNDLYMTNKKSWRRKMKTWLSKLNEEYLDSPWSIMEVIKTTIELAATVGATYYGYKSYKLNYSNSHLLYNFIRL